MQIVQYPHPTLRHKSKPLRRVDAELRQVIGQMFELMHDHQGIGLAANQVDLPYRLFIMHLPEDESAPDQELVFINPVISGRKGSVEREEGCLSFPELYAQVRRPEKVEVTAYNLAGEEVQHELTGLASRAAQHEADHLDGVLFIDRLAPSVALSVQEDLFVFERQFQYERDQGRMATDEVMAARLAQLEAART